MADPRAELRVAKTTVDETGMTHLTLEQYYAGLPVFQSQIKLHVSADQRLKAVNGRYLPGINVSVTPALDANAAEESALRALGLKRADAAFRPARLVIYPTGEQTTLAWWLDVTTAASEAWWYLIDARTGRVLHRYARVYDAAPTGMSLADLQERERAPLSSADEERCLVGDRVWVRSRGETRFRRAESVDDLGAEARRLEIQQAEIARSTVYDVSLDLRNSRNYAAVASRGYGLLSAGVDGFYHAMMSKAETNALAALGIPLELYPDLPPEELAQDVPDRVGGASHGSTGESLDQTMWSQGYEGAFPTLGWVVGDSSALNGQDYWDEATCRAHDGTFSAWCAKAGSTNPCVRYDHSMRAYMRSPSVNLTGRTNCQLSYWWWNNSEPNFDFFREYYSIDGVHWIPGAQHAGNDASWHNATVNLNGFSLYYEMFFFYSDLAINNYEGAYIDDVNITADWAPCGEIGGGTGVLGVPRTHLDVDYQGGMFRLNDLTRQSDTLCWHNHGGQMAAGAAIATYNYNGAWPSHVGTLFVDSDNVWNSTPPAVDAHFFAARYYDFLLNQFGRNGPTGVGAEMWSTVNVSTLFNNAAYSAGRVGYGIAGSGHRSMAGAPDLVGHEWSHGITESESGLLAEKESGALAESFSDIMGAAFGFLTSADPDWQIGENANIGGLANRDLSNPPSKSQPDFYGGTYWVPQEGCTPTNVNDYCGIHTNSGVGNKFYYLLAQGGVVHGVTVTGIGIANAANVVYRANRDYWTSTTNYPDARAGCIAAAGVLNPAWVNSVTDAWAAVGVGDPSEHPLACASPVALTSGVAFGSTTVGAPRNVMDYNSCPWWESGPERVHRVTLTRAATLNIALTNTTANLDVFLLNTCGDNACIAYGDSVIRYTAAPGTYYIVVDGYQGAEGAYRLTATAIGTILLTAPNGGETWYTGESRVISWSSSLMENLRLEIDRNYPSVWAPVALSVSNSGVYTWHVTSPVTGNARIRITGATHPAVGDTSNASFAIATRSVHLTSPNGGEIWAMGDPQDITWTSQGMDAESLRIELKRSFPAGIWEPLVIRAPNTGSFTWNVAGTASNTARIRILGTQHTTVIDTSDAGFVLTAGGVNPTLTVVAPDGGENWAVSSVQEIRWASASMAENVKIELNRNYPNGLWELLVASAVNDGVHPWTVTGPTTSAARVRISGTVSVDVVDSSIANFTISSSGGSGTLTVLEPNGGETWVVGTGHTFRWTTSGFSENVKIQINRMYPGGYWITIISSTPNDGTHNWIVTPSASTHARVRIIGATSAAIGDTSDSDFNVYPRADVRPGTDQRPGRSG